MDETDYNKSNSNYYRINNEKKISVIEEMFYKKMEKLKKSL